MGQGTGKICSLYRCFGISRFFSIYFTITGVKKIVRYTEDLLYRGSLYRGSTVLSRYLRDVFNLYILIQFLYKNVDKRSYIIKLKNNRPDVLVMKF